MLREIVDALHAFAATRPLVLLLEDLQWRDASTVDLLGAIAYGDRGVAGSSSRQTTTS